MVEVEVDGGVVLSSIWS